MLSSMRILIVTDAWRPQINGVVRTYEHLSVELEKLGHHASIIGPCNFPLTIPLPGYHEIRLAVAPYRRLARMTRDFAPDHIHIATEGPLGWAARRYAIGNGRDFSTSYHTHFPDYVARRFAKFGTAFYGFLQGLGKKYVTAFHARSRVTLAPTQSVEDQLRRWGFRTPLARFSRGVDCSLFYPGPKALFSGMKRPVALYVGRIAVEKSVEDFLRMEWHGSKAVVGDGPDLISLRNKYPGVFFAGRRTGEDLAAHYRSADLFVFPSRTDTFGLVLIEALASGLPVAAYDVAGPRDIISESFLGALDQDLSTAARRALNCGSEAERAAYVQDRYTWKTAALQFIDTVESNRICESDMPSQTPNGIKF